MSVHLLGLNSLVEVAQLLPKGCLGRFLTPAGPLLFDRWSIPIRQATFSCGWIPSRFLTASLVIDEAATIIRQIFSIK